MEDAHRDPAARREQELRAKQKTGIGAQYPKHTQNTGQYPRQQKRSGRTRRTRSTPPEGGGIPAAGGPVEIDVASSTNPLFQPQEASMDTHEVKGAAREVAGKAEQTYGRVKDQVTQTAQEISSDIESGGYEGSLDRTLALVQENPGTAIGLSLLAGAGLGALLVYMAKD